MMPLSTKGCQYSLKQHHGCQRQMSHVISGEVFRLWTANFSDKEANSQRGGLKILKTRKSQAERINEAERTCCLVSTINDKLSYSSCSSGRRWQKGKQWVEKKNKLRVFPQGASGSAVNH